MKLEVAFDDVDLARCLDILSTSAEDIDIIEVGTLFIIKEGLEPVRKIRSLYPDKTILADPKIMDAADVIARYCFEAGADIVTVMGVSSEATIRKVIAAAKKYGKKVFIDLLDVEDVADKLEYFDSLGADILCIHSSKNADRPPFEDLAAAKKTVKNSEIAIAGGINLSSIDSAAALSPDIIIAGSGIYKADDPAAVIRAFKEHM